MWERPSLTVVGHRGVRRGENTLGAFEQALAEGADAVELDVRLCATGEVVVFHDVDLARATGHDTRAVRRVPYVDLASLRLFGSDQGAPLLRDVLSLVGARGAGVNVELKYDDVDRPRLVRAVARELARAQPLDVILSSFDPRLLLGMKVCSPRARIALLTTTQRGWSLPLARHAARAFHAVHLDRVQVTPELVAHLAGRTRVGVWTVNVPEEARRLQAMGVAWIITDTPRAIREAIHEG